MKAQVALLGAHQDSHSREAIQCLVNVPHTEPAKAPFPHGECRAKNTQGATEIPKNLGHSCRRLHVLERKGEVESAEFSF